jgi:hypothetical protein
MKTIKFYDSIPDMEWLQGDTLPEFYIGIENASAFSELSLILESPEFPEQAVLTKTGTASEKGFSVQLTSEDTKELTGIYRLHVCLKSNNGLKYKKMTCNVNVIPVAEGG